MARPQYWTREKIIEVASEYSFKVDLQRDHEGCYRALIKNHKDLADELFPIFKKNIWTFDKLKKEALKYSNKKDFRIISNGAYSRACETGVLDEICKHMENMRIQNGRFDLGKYENISGLYFLYDKEKLVYIGKSHNCVVSRIRDHYKDKRFDNVEIYNINNSANIYFLEQYLILKNKPKYNIEYNVEDELSVHIEDIDELIGKPIVVSASFCVNVSNNIKDIKLGNKEGNQ